VFPLEKIEEILNPEKENIFLRCRKKDWRKRFLETG
jgi:hypothetical protein